MKKIVGVILDGEKTYHAPYLGGNDYDTLCGIDASTDGLGPNRLDDEHGGLIDVPKGQKIDCLACKQIFLGFQRLKLRKTDFET